jgi:hypothetical protein
MPGAGGGGAHFSFRGDGRLACRHGKQNRGPGVSRPAAGRSRGPGRWQQVARRGRQSGQPAEPRRRRCRGRRPGGRPSPEGGGGTPRCGQLTCSLTRTRRRQHHRLPEHPYVPRVGRATPSRRPPSRFATAAARPDGFGVVLAPGERPHLRRATGRRILRQKPARQMVPRLARRLGCHRLARRRNRGSRSVLDDCIPPTEPAPPLFGAQREGLVNILGRVSRGDGSLPGVLITQSDRTVTSVYSLERRQIFTGRGGIRLGSDWAGPGGGTSPGSLNASQQPWH